MLSYVEIQWVVVNFYMVFVIVYLLKEYGYNQCFEILIYYNNLYV